MRLPLCLVSESARHRYNRCSRVCCSVHDRLYVEVLVAVTPDKYVVQQRALGKAWFVFDTHLGRSVSADFADCDDAASIAVLLNGAHRRVNS